MANEIPNKYPENDYSSIIKKLKRRRSLIITLAILCLIPLFILANDWKITLMGTTYQNPGWPGILSVPLALLILFVALIAYGTTILPIDKALDEECDPYKCLALYKALGSQQENDPRRMGIHYICLFHMGRYHEALTFAAKLAKHKNPILRTEGHYFCAQLGYFMGDVSLLKEAALHYRADLASITKMKDKHRAIFESRTAMIAVMEGLYDGNHQAVAEAIPYIKPWSPAPIVSLQMDLLRGIAAFPRPGGGNRDEAVYRFMSVKEKGGRTSFVTMAEWYLQQLQKSPDISSESR
ncbi:MAG: hypothetical protein E7645_00575 [Ruminococcaceae bacterium]|nr:hypothetical protein [Oscillospiraceae bacterium]